jgi:hypothetical protein
MTIIIEANQTHRFPPVGECIYCGKKAGLSDEHIVPFALAGNLILPDASCKKCREITSLIEWRVLRGFMFDARVVGNFPSRRKKVRPSTVRTKLISEDDRLTVHDIPVKDAAAFLILPLFARATILNKQPPAVGVTIIGQEVLHFGKNVEHLVRGRDAKGIEFDSQIQATEFARLLAKIAYGYLVATMGLFPRDETPLLRLIRGEADDGACWVGSREYKLEVEAKNPQHALGVLPCSNENNVQAFLVLVKLFASSGATGYEVATRIPGWQQYGARA